MRTKTEGFEKYSVMNKLVILLIAIFPSISFAQITIDRDNDGNVLKEKYPNNHSVSYKYDSAGNRIMTIVSDAACPGDNSLLYAGTSSATTYQWQVDTSTGYNNITDNTVYSGSQASFLKLNNPPTFWYGYKYRCLINGTDYSDTITLKFQLIWSGSVSDVWENPANWSCNKVPDGYTDVIVNGNMPFNPVVSSNAEVRSIVLSPTANCIVNNPFVMKVTAFTR